MLKLLKFSHKKGSKKYNLYKCHCGKEKIIREDSVSPKPIVKSCGCRLRKWSIKLGKSRKTHGMSKTRLYGIWSSLQTRCYNKKYPEIKYYGGRGIKVSDEWKKFENFYRDMSPSYKKGLQIDRIDNDGDYSKENCRWVTPSQNSLNKRNNIILTYKCKSMPLAKWSRQLGVDYKFLHNRIHVLGWSTERAFETKKLCQ